MTHHILLTAMRDGQLGDAAKTVLSYLYGRTNGTLKSAVFIDEICGDLDIAESTLRRRRAELAAYLRSERDGDTLTFEIHAPECADFARADSAHIDENAQNLHTERAESAQSGPERAEIARAESAQSAPERAESAHSAPPERANSAHSLPRAERENDASAPPCTPRKGIVKYAAGGCTTSSIRGGAGGAEADRARSLLVAAGVEDDKAADLANATGLEPIARHIAAWQIAKVNMRLGVGALIHRITKWPVPVVAVADLRAGILAGHIDDDDLARWGLRTDPLAGYTAPAGYEGIIQH